MAYSSPAHIHNVDLSTNDALEFPDLSHRRRNCTSSLLDSDELKVGVSQDHPKMDLDMIASLILPIVKADPRTSMSVLIANICSQLRYTPSYCKAWIAKQKALEKMHSGLLRHVCPQLDIYIISIRGTGILTAIERQGNLWDCTHHRYCLRHIASNYYGVVCTFRYQLILTEYDINKDRFHEMLAILRSVNDQGANYLYNRPFDQWTQAYDGGLLYGHMTSNMTKCINSILKGTHHFPITSVVQVTYFRLAVLFPKRAASYKSQMQGDHVWCRKVLQEINKVNVRTNTIHTVCHDRDNQWFGVMEFDRPNQGITGGLRNRTCDCGMFDALHYPCAHTIATCQNLRLDLMSYVNEVYKIEYMYNVWRHVFPLNQCHMGVVDSYALDSLLVQLSVGVVGVGRMTHIDRIKNAEVFASPTVEVFESYKTMGIGNEINSLMVPCAIPLARWPIYRWLSRSHRKKRCTVPCIPT
ncbi:hypothetical protein GOBAR_AA23334 [Gossypium barbadense]|uniref:SWIM-type domain-containing protein n=1 Tax=Gossypium barbadense TaxID=3634 RepID=A0A2P5X1Z1_GOSBA|nr:hypothetical protein GOBAR_AA23334 [Gossypium barbadense]